MEHQRLMHWSPSSGWGAVLLPHRDPHTQCASLYALLCLGLSCPLQPSFPSPPSCSSLRSGVSSLTSQHDWMPQQHPGDHGGGEPGFWSQGHRSPFPAVPPPLQHRQGAYAFWGRTGIINRYLKLKIEVKWRLRIEHFSKSILFLIFFFDVGHCKSLHWICYNIASVLGFGFGHKACGS